MYIPGINYYFHDSTACIIRDGKLVAAIEKERLSRDKHTRAFPRKAIARCLQMAGINYVEIQHIAISIKPTHTWDKKIGYALSNLKSLKPFFKHEIVHGYNKQQELWNWCRQIIKKRLTDQKYISFRIITVTHLPLFLFLLMRKLPYWVWTDLENGRLPV